MFPNVNSGQVDAMKFQLDQPTVLEWIGYNEICQNARFVFDRPHVVNVDDVLELSDGCFYLIREDGRRVAMNGRWDR